MCGKFSAKRWWRLVTDFAVDQAEPMSSEGADDSITYGVMGMLPVIVWDKSAGKRVRVPMRWGFPDPKSWKIPRPIHARSETVDSTKAFAQAFADGQRGIVVFETFNEGEETTTNTGKPKTVQWVVDPQDSNPRGFAFIWRRFEIADLPQPMLAAVMCTVPANDLLRRTFMANQDDPRMPAILDDADWATWLGESGAPLSQAKAALKTVEGVTWRAEREAKKPKG